MYHKVRTMTQLCTRTMQSNCKNCPPAKLHKNKILRRNFFRVVFACSNCVI